MMSDARHAVQLAIADLRYEWILSACMMIALAAIFAPLFILEGLQSGIVGNMLNELERDPKARLVTPKGLVNPALDEAWLEKLRDQSDFMIASPVPVLNLNIEGYSKHVATVPTAPSDPLLQAHKIHLQDEQRALVLSQHLADLTGKKTGQQINLILIRDTGKMERHPIPFQVAGVLPDHIADGPKIWLPKRYFDDIYEWRKGYALTSLKLSSVVQSSMGRFDGILTVADKLPSPADYRSMLAGRFSFSQAPRPIENPGWLVEPDQQMHLWQVIGNRVYAKDFREMVNKHNEFGYPVETIPYIDPFDVTLETGENTKNLSLTILPDALLSKPACSNDTDFPVWIAPSGSPSDQMGKIIFSTVQPDSSQKVAVRICQHEAVRPGHLALGADLAGKLNAVRHREARFDPITREFLPIQRGMRFFRAYAESINQIEDLVTLIKQEGGRTRNHYLTQPNSRLSEVHNIQRLASYMRDLYLLIVLVASIAGILAVFANVYASVERKRRDLAYLQLMGVKQYAIYLFPYLKSFFLVVGGLAFSLVAYACFAYLADRQFSSAIGSGLSLTDLPLQQAVLLIGGILFFSSIASLLATIRVTGIDPGEYIRE